MVGATVNVTEPAPEPLAPDVILIQGALLRAVQAHCGSEAVIITTPVPPVAGKELFCVAEKSKQG